MLFVRAAVVGRVAWPMVAGLLIAGIAPASAQDATEPRAFASQPEVSIDELPPFGPDSPLFGWQPGDPAITAASAEPAIEAPADPEGAAGVGPAPRNLGGGYITVAPATSNLVATFNNSLLLYTPAGAPLGSATLPEPAAQVLFTETAVTVLVFEGETGGIARLLSYSQATLAPTSDHSVNVGLFQGAFVYAGGRYWLNTGVGSMSFDPVTEATAIYDFTVYSGVAGRPDLLFTTDLDEFVLMDVSVEPPATGARRRLDTALFVYPDGSGLVSTSTDLLQEYSLPDLLPTGRRFQANGSPIALSNDAERLFVSYGGELQVFERFSGETAPYETLETPTLPFAVTLDGRAVAVFTPDRPRPLRIVRLGPKADDVGHELFNPSLSKRMRLSGSGLASTNLVEVNGDAVDFEVIDARLIEVQVVATQEATASIVVTTGFGTTEPIVVPTEAPDGFAAVVIRTSPNAVAQNTPARLVCRDRYLRRPRARVITLNPAEERVLVVPKLRSCQLDPGATRGYLIGENGEAGPDIYQQIVPFLTGRPVRIGLRAPVLTKNVLWVFAQTYGDGPPGAEYRIRISCGRQRRVVTVDANSGARLLFPPQADRCRTRVVNDAGAVRTVPVVGTTMGLYGGAEFLSGYATFVAVFFDHGGGDRYVPIAVGSPATGPGVVELFPSGFDGLARTTGARRVKAPGGRAGDGFGTATVFGDFNGDGWADLAVGAPGATANRRRQAGRVYMISGGRQGIVDRPGSVGLPEAERGDRAGAALAVMDLDNDGYDDLAVGMPGATPFGSKRTGAVVVVFGSPRGLDEGRTERFVPPRNGSAAGDGFGALLSGAGEWLAIGAPGRSVDGRRNAGAVTLVSPLRDVDQLVTSPQPQTGERFGAALSIGPTLMTIGAPGRDVDGAADAGAFVVAKLGVKGAGPRTLVTQETLRFDSEPGDGLGTAVWSADPSPDIIVGIPGEDVGGVDAGLIVLVQEPVVGNDVFFSHPDINDNAGESEAGDRFGSVISVGLRGAVLVGIPQEDVGGSPDAGAIWMLGGTTGEIDRSTRGVAGNPTPGGGFGATVS
jgi:hypothetical protein